MADEKYIVLGNVVLVVMIFVVLLSQWILPPIYDILGNDLQGIAWVGTFAIWIIGLLIIPIGIKIYGLTTATQNRKQMFNIATAVVYGLFVLIFFYFAWNSIIKGIAGLFVYDIITITYWAAIISTLLFDGVGIPAYLIVEARNQN